MSAKIKEYVKIAVVGIVILGMTASYIFSGSGQAPQQTQNQQPVDSGIDFQGPTAPPSAQGPSNQPPN